jgi:hypothetical protein
MELAMLENGVKMTRSHLLENLAVEDRRLMLRQHARASAHYAWRLLKRGRLSSVACVVATSVRMDLLWPARAAGLMLERLLHSASSEKA